MTKNLSLSFERIFRSLSKELERLDQNYTAFNLRVNTISFVNSVIKRFISHPIWALESVEFHRASFAENEIRGNREKRAARQKAPATTQKKSAEEKGWDKLGESEWRRGRDERAKNSSRRGWSRVTFSPYSSIESYIRTYVHSVAGVSVR